MQRELHKSVLPCSGQGRGNIFEADDAMSHVQLSVQYGPLQSQVSQMEQTLNRLLLSRLQSIQRSCQAH